MARNYSLARPEPHYPTQLQAATLGTVIERRLIVIIRCMKRKLAPKIIEYLKAPGPKRLDVWDTVLQGFGVRVSPNGRKVWFAVVRSNGRQKRVTIGTYPAISLAEASSRHAPLRAKLEQTLLISKGKLGSRSGTRPGVF